MKRVCSALFGLILMTSCVNAQIVVDGVLDDDYSLAAVQTTQTGFGNAVAPDYFGSELDALYTAVEGSRIFVLLTGNLEGNFNKLEVLFDSVSGGENSLSSIPQYDFLAGGGPNWQSQLLGGLISGGPGWTFDPGFNADYHLICRRGFDGKAGNVLDVDFVDRMGGGAAMVPGNSNRAPFDFDSQTGAGTIQVGDLGNNSSGDAISNPISFGMDNSNELGVGGDQSMPADQAAAAAVTTGFEFSIDVSDLGLNPEMAGVIKIVAAVNGSSHDYLSNQVLPGLPALTTNLGGDNTGAFIGDLGFVSFASLAGEQFFCIEYGGGILVGDVNGDGMVNLSDVQPFVALLSAGGFLPEADINGDGVVSLLDVAPFVQLLSGG